MLAPQDAALYREPYILRDILNHRAAAIALAYLHSKLGSGQPQHCVAALMAAMRYWRRRQQWTIITEACALQAQCPIPRATVISPANTDDARYGTCPG